MFDTYMTRGKENGLNFDLLHGKQEVIFLRLRARLVSYTCQTQPSKSGFDRRTVSLTVAYKKRPPLAWVAKPLQAKAFEIVLGTEFFY